jgi:hypothetical protein
MKSLADRHADRARRIVANGTELANNTSNSVGTVAALFSDFITAHGALNEDQRAEFEAVAGNIQAEAEARGHSLAEAPDGSGRTMAGIGVINTNVVPAAFEAPEAGNGGGTSLDNVDGWGAAASPAATVKTSDTNLGGEALAAQGADGSGGNTGDDSDPLAGSVDALKTHLETVNDAGELDRLVDAEKAGQNRSTAIAAIEARKTALTA